ncbi:condensation domain-containing protein, partial [Streptomyces morookaense]
AYWNDLLADLDEAPVLRQDTGTSVEVGISLDAERTALLLDSCQRAFGTRIDEFLLAAFGQALTGLTGRSISHLMVEGHGREEFDAQTDVSRTVGWFTTLHPVRLEVCDDPADTLKSVKDGLRAVPDKGIGYGP